MAGVGLELCAGDEGDWIVSYIEEGYGADASKAILRGDKVCLPVSLTSSHADHAQRDMAEGAPSLSHPSPGDESLILAVSSA